MLVALNRPAHLHITVRDYDGELVTASTTVTVSVTDVDGEVVATGTAAPSIHGHHVDGWYDYTLPSAVTGTLGKYDATATWTISGETSSVTYGLETVGEYLFDVADLRAFDAAVTANDYDADKIREARDWATDRLERAAQVAFATRRTVETRSGDDTTRLMMEHTRITRVNSVTVYGEDTGVDLVDDEFDAGQLADAEIDADAGVLVRASGYWQGDTNHVLVGTVWPRGHNNIVVDYEHGYEQVPGPVKNAAMMLAIEYLVKSALPARATAQATDLGDFRISLANVDAGRDTGIPEVDAVIHTYGARRPRIA
jgi:hypothetical protein